MVPSRPLDCFCLGGEEMDAVKNLMLVMLGEEKGHRYAKIIEHKGFEHAGKEWLVVDAAEEARSWGGTVGQPLVIKSDNEASIVAVQEALSRYLGGPVTPENPPVGESGSNGAVEEAGRTIREIMKLHKCQLEAKVGHLSDNFIILQWMARWAAMVCNRYHSRAAMAGRHSNGKLVDRVGQSVYHSARRFCRGSPRRQARRKTEWTPSGET